MKIKSEFICRECGHKTSKWYGRCPGCGEWNTMEAQYSHSYAASPTMRHNPYEDRTDNCFYQPGNLYRLMSEDKRDKLISNTVEDMMTVTDNIKYRHAAHCYLADAEYGIRLAEAMKIDVQKVIDIAQMSESDRLYATRTLV